MGAVAVDDEHVRQRRIAPAGNREVIVEAAVDLDLADVADAEADADRRETAEVAGQARRRVVDVGRIVEACFHQHASGADRFRVLGDERPLLGEGADGNRTEQCCENENGSGHQGWRLLSMRMVTGPSLTSSTRIIAWNSPVATGTPAARNSLTRSS